MNFKIIISLQVIMFGMILMANSQKMNFDKPAFYCAMATDKLEQINTQLAMIKGSSMDEKDAYEGALMMKKAGLITNTKEKINLFKAGRSKLEAAIKKDIANTEFYFLRLIIQEHAPKVVNYRNNLQNDSLLIRSNFKTLPLVVQKAINEYSKNSKILKSL